MSSFSGLSIALSSLYAQRRGLDVTGQNIANTNTDGYTRQRVNLQSVGGPVVPAMWSVWRGGGAGVEVTDVERLQNAFLEARGRTEHMQSAYLTDQARMQGAIEEVFNEPSDTGLQAQLSVFWNSWQDVANRPSDTAARQQLIQQGATVADTMNNSYEALDSLWTTTRDQLDSVVAEINRTASSVSELNAAIIRMKGSDLPYADLADQRDLLVMKLSELTGAAAVAKADGSVDVNLGGGSLVSGITARSLEAAGSTTLAGQAADPVLVRWVDTAATATIPGGQVASTLYTLGTAVPAVVTDLDQVAATLAGTVNTQHALGYDLDGIGGTAFFSGTTASTIGVAISDPRKIAASSDGTQTLNGQNADAISRLAPDTDDLYNSVVVKIGVASQNAARRAEIQQVITQSIDEARAAESGVNLDEEMTNLLMFQRGYESASRIVTTIDEMFDSLLGMVR